MIAVTIKMLKGGNGKVLIHWFCRKDEGPIQTKGVVRSTAAGPLRLGNASGRIACSPQQTELHSVKPNGECSPVVHSDDPRAANCPECLATPEYKLAMDQMSE